MIRLRLALALFSLFFAALSASAQLGVYGTVTVEPLHGIKCLDTSCGSNNGTIDPLGGVGGVYYDFKSYGRVRLGVDVRAGSSITSKNAAQYLTGPKPRIFSALGGVRASFSTRYDALRPYVQGSIGMAKSNLQTAVTSTALQYPTGLEYRGFAGADLRLLPFLDFRVVELGIGAVQLQGNTYRIESISTGVVFHFAR